MKRTCFLVVFLMTILSSMVSCSQPRIQTDSVKELKATRLIPGIVLATQALEATVTATPHTENTITTYCLQPPSIGKEIILTSPEIMIVQYYTLLDIGLYDEAYNFLSSSRPNVTVVQSDAIRRKVA